MTLADLRRADDRFWRVYGDVKAISRGPKAIGRRLLRRTVARNVFRVLRKGRL